MSAAIMWAMPSAQADSHIFQSITAKKSDVTLELRGEEKGYHHGTEAWIKSKTGRTKIKSADETYITEGAISDDARFVYLRYHISSGVYDEMLVRGAKGRYTHFLDSEKVAEILQASKAGANFKGIKGLECDFTGFGPDPERLSFDVIVFRGSTFGSVTLNSKTRQVVAWSRDHLAAEFVTRIDDENTVARTLKLQQVNGQPGTVLAAASSDAKEPPQTLAVFPPVAGKFEGKKRFTLISQTAPKDRIELTATPAEANADSNEARWQVEIGGEGKSFAKLSERLAAMRKLWITDADSAEDWASPLEFFAVHPEPR